MDNKRGQKLKNSWTAAKERNLTEMHRNLGMKSVLQRGMLEKTQLCQITSRDITGKGKEDGVRVWPRDAERCQLQHKGKPATDGGVQTDMMGSKWQSHLSSFLLAPAGTDLHLGVCL